MLHLVTGPPCGGKSHYIAEHKAPNDLVIDSDAMAVALGSPVEHEHPEPVNGLALALRDTLIGQAGHHPEWTVWMTQTFMSEETLAEHRKQGHRIHVVNPGATTVLARLDERNASSEIRGVVYDWYRKMPPRLP